MSKATDDVIKWVESTDRRKAPFRRVLGEHQNAAGSWVEELECGHEQHKRSDYIGPTNAYRRRCLKCLEEGK